MAARCLEIAIAAELSNVRALVFLAAIGLDVGESVAGVQEPFPPPMVVTTSYLTEYDAPGAAGGPELYIQRQVSRDFLRRRAR